MRDIIPPLAALFVALAAIVDPAQWWRVVVLTVPVAMFACWHRWPVLLLPLAVVVQVGRCSLQELHRAVALLRRDGDRADSALPSITLVASLVDTFRDAGLAVDYREVGDLSVVAPSVGLTLYRVAQ